MTTHAKSHVSLHRLPSRSRTRALRVPAVWAPPTFSHAPHTLIVYHTSICVWDPNAHALVLTHSWFHGSCCGEQCRCGCGFGARNIHTGRELGILLCKHQVYCERQYVSLPLLRGTVNTSRFSPLSVQCLLSRSHHLICLETLPHQVICVGVECNEVLGK
jgi:hypothetical protein